MKKDTRIVAVGGNELVNRLEFLLKRPADEFERYQDLLAMLSRYDMQYRHDVSFLRNTNPFPATACDSFLVQSKHANRNINSCDEARSGRKEEILV